MKELILLCLFALLLYIITILCVQYIKKISTKDAQKIVLEFLKDCMSTSTPSSLSYYPVFIGIDDNGCPHADIIENEFHSLSNIFSQFYFHSCGRKQNRIWYAFNVSNPLKEMSEYELIQYCEKICDTLIHRYVHKKNPSITHINNLVSIHYQESILTIFIAITDNGTIENSNQTLQTRNSYNQSIDSPNATITESWSDQ